MKLFISWSGNISHQVALIFREWLPYVLPFVQPHVSSEDIEKGTHWRSKIAGEIEEADAGIICVTRDNLDSRWLNFEAGALSNSLKSDMPNLVCPFLFGIDDSDLEGPLQLFQTTKYKKDDIRKLVFTLNNIAAPNTKIDERRLEVSYENWWPKLEDELEKLYQIVDKIIVWSFESREINATSEIESIQNEGFKTHIKWFLDEKEPDTTRCDFIVYLFKSASNQKENLEKIVAFTKSHSTDSEIPILIYTRFANRRLSEDESSPLQNYENHSFSNMLTTLKTHFKNLL